MSTQHEEMLKRFDERLKKRIEKGGFTYLYENRDEIDTEAIKAFLISEIDLAVAEERKMIVGLLKKHSDEINFDEWEVGEIIELILKNK